MPSTFDPVKHGFKFRNAFTNHRFEGPVHITTGGRCGGMVYAALDYFNKGLAIPSTRTLPSDGTALGNYISDRQDRSMLDTWVLFFERWVNPFGWRTSEFFNWGVDQQFTALRSHLDAGHPVPLGLSRGGGPDGTDHQVLAIGYSKGSGKKFTIELYDPNYPNETTYLRPIESMVRFEEKSKNSVQHWITYFVNNAYRLANPPASADAKVPGRNYSDRNFSGQNLLRRKFINSTCHRTLFIGANVRQTDFTGADTSWANFTGADLKSATLSGANLYKATFHGSDARNCSLPGVSARYANFYGATVSVSKFNGADLHGAVLQGANCQQANFAGATFGTANLHGADLRGASVLGANLKNANLNGTDLRGARYNAGTVFPSGFSPSGRGMLRA